MTNTLDQWEAEAKEDLDAKYFRLDPLGNNEARLANQRILALIDLVRTTKSEVERLTTLVRKQQAIIEKKDEYIKEIGNCGCLRWDNKDLLEVPGLKDIICNKCKTIALTEQLK